MVNEGAAVENVVLNEVVDDENQVANRSLLWEMWELLPWGIIMPLLWQMVGLLRGMRRLSLWGMAALGIRVLLLWIIDGQELLYGMMGLLLGLLLGGAGVLLLLRKWVLLLWQMVVVNEGGYCMECGGK